MTDTEIAELKARIANIELHLGLANPEPVIPIEFNFDGCERNFQKKKTAWLGYIAGAVAAEFQKLAFQDNLYEILSRGRGSIVGTIIYDTAQQVVEDVARFIASEITGETDCRQRLNAFELFRPRMETVRVSEHPDVQHARLKAELGVRRRHTQELLSEAKLPPVPDALTRAMARLAKGMSI